MIKFYDFLLTILTPIIKLISKVGIPKRKINGKHYYKLRDSILIGDVFLTKTNNELSNLVNPNELKHSATYVGSILGSKSKYVVEATMQGVKLTDLVTFMMDKDILIHCHPKFIRNPVAFEDMTKAAALKYKGIPYDYLFNKDARAFYCFELCAKLFTDFYPHMQLKCKEIIKNKKIYSPETFLDEEMFEVLFDSRENK